MSIEANSETSMPNRLKLDAKGRALPRTEAEVKAQREALSEALRKMEEIEDDDPPGSTEEFFRSIDEGRPYRPLFEGMY